MCICRCLQTIRFYSVNVCLNLHFCFQLVLNRPHSCSSIIIIFLACDLETSNLLVLGHHPTKIMTHMCCNYPVPNKAGNALSLSDSEFPIYKLYIVVESMFKNPPVTCSSSSRHLKRAPKHCVILITASFFTTGDVFQPLFSAKGPSGPPLE